MNDRLKWAASAKPAAWAASVIMDMPGLDTLTKWYADIDVTLDSVAGGARLTYDARDEELVVAIHGRFDRQTMDHS